MRILGFSRRSKLEGSNKGLITVSTLIFVSVFILFVLISFSFLNRYIKYYHVENIMLKSVTSIHDAIVNSCCNGYGGTGVVVFVPSGSYILFRENYISIVGVDIKTFNKEFLETILKSRIHCSFLDIEVEIDKDSLLLKYYILVTSERRQITFTSFTVPPGSHVIFLYCKAFHKIEITIASSG